MYREINLGGIQVAPFVAYAIGALLVLLALRFLFARIRFERYVANPPLAEAGLYVIILALLIVFV